VAAVCLFALYALSQPWHLRGNISDVEAATLPAWHIVETGTWDLSELADDNPWFVEVPGGVWTNRSPGIVGVALIGYALTSPFTDTFQNWPGTLTAITTSWLAVLVVAAAAERLRPGAWLLALAIFGLGTATWGVAAEQLWPHGPAQLAVALSIWLVLTGKGGWAGFAMALAVVIRPPLIVIAMGVAVAQAAVTRTVRPLLTMGLPSTVAAAAYLLYNRVLFDSWSPTAAYEAVGGFVAEFDLLGLVGNVVTAFVGPSHGVLVWSPWIIVALFALHRLRGRVPQWLMYTPAVAAVYIVAHSLLEIASGALFFNYRYQLEAVTLAAPLLIATIPEFDDARPRRIVMGVAIAVSIVLQIIFVFVSKCFIDESGTFTCSLIP
jgi:hypothetical protein